MTLKKGTHGVLENGNSGVKVPAEVYWAQPDFVSVIIDGAQSVTIFRYAEQWTFTPDKPTLPTESGLYVASSTVQADESGVSPTAVIFKLRCDIWEALGYAGSDGARSYAQKMLETHGLTKVKLVVA